ncbi:MAG: glutamate--tRNA ligase [Pseudomonadota bacterium]
MITTRFAPSPTGALHLGNIRTALFNALIARGAGGKFILRIDDTDRERSELRHADSIRTDLSWLGLNWDDEYRQSDRMDMYYDAAAKLKTAGRLYPCWETAEELALKRKRQLAMKRPPVYDRAALSLTDAQKTALTAQRPAHWRFRLDHEVIEWTDGVRGPQSIDASSVSDPVLIREDGQFLYTLCSVVDDAAMGITDIVRGADHVTNTATQFQIFGALGTDAPRAAHHSLMTGEGGEKLSKRVGGLSVADMRDAGAEPLAIISYLARLGSSAPVVPVWSVAEAAAGFDISSFGLSPTRVAADEVMQLSQKMLHDAPFEAVADRLPDGIDAAFWDVVRPNLQRLSDAADWLAIAEAASPVIAPEDADFVAEAVTYLPPKPWGATSWQDWTSAVKIATGRKGRGLFLPLRRYLTGRDNGPDMSAFMPYLKR